MAPQDRRYSGLFGRKDPKNNRKTGMSELEEKRAYEKAINEQGEFEVLNRNFDPQDSRREILSELYKILGDNVC